MIAFKLGLTTTEWLACGERQRRVSTISGRELYKQEDAVNGVMILVYQLGSTT